MKVTVYLTRWADGAERTVEIPDGDHSLAEILEMTFHFGQNDFQPRQQPSVSVGDVIAAPDGSHHRVMPVGFERLDDDEDPLATLGRNVDDLVYRPASR